MGLDIIEPAKKRLEDETEKELFSHIDKKQSLVFNAGAGAGKTYALVESLRHVIKECGEGLKANNQQIMCITYTNVAAKHIKDKLGNSRLVMVSTIHERLWQLIEPYQEQLRSIHKEKLEKEIQDDIYALTDESAKDEKIFKVYRELSAEDKVAFGEAVWKHRDEFYQGYSDDAKTFSASYGRYIQEYKGLLKNVGHFRKIVSKIYRIRQYKECIAMMTSGEREYRKVKYNARYNQDQLHRMRISHDTLLEYSRKLVLQYPALRQIIIDKFPYIFIDEYQDTAEDVVEIMAVLEKRGQEIGHKVFIGYYGDPVQNIYENGVGNRLLEKHPGLKEVKKQFNRRSYEEIIKVANRIRLDGLQQESIYADCKGGTTEYCAKDDFDTVLETCQNAWKGKDNKPIHCFLLKNEEVAKRTGISNIYNVFKGSKAYSGSRYQQLNTELLANDIEKLGRAASFLYRILKFYTDVREEDTPVEEILYGDIVKYANLNIQKLKSLKRQLREIKGSTLDDIIKEMCGCYDTGDVNIKRIIEAVLDMEKVSYPYVVSFLVQALDSNHVPREDEETNVEDLDLDRVKQLLTIDIKEFEMWFYYVERKQRSEIVYHTYHGTKGLEFQNVLIVVEDGFGKSAEDKVFIKKFLENFAMLDENPPIGDYEKARNLLYVAVTRAIKNLKVVYDGDSEKVKETLNAIFNG